MWVGGWVGGWVVGVNTVSLHPRPTPVAHYLSVTVFVPPRPLCLLLSDLSPISISRPPSRPLTSFSAFLARLVCNEARCRLRWRLNARAVTLLLTARGRAAVQGAGRGQPRREAQRDPGLPQRGKHEWKGGCSERWTLAKTAFLGSRIASDSGTMWPS